MTLETYYTHSKYEWTLEKYEIKTTTKDKCRPKKSRYFRSPVREDMGDDFHSFKEFNNKYFNLATLRSWLTKQQAFLSLPKKKTHEHWGCVPTSKSTPTPQHYFAHQTFPQRKTTFPAPFSFLFFSHFFLFSLYFFCHYFIYIYIGEKKRVVKLF